MTNKNLTVLLATLLALIVGGGAGFALAQGTGLIAAPAASADATAVTEKQLPYPEGGGTLILRVNPEFAIHYDAQGKVVGVEELNDDAHAMALDLASYEGQECRAAVQALVTKIREAGYFVEEIEGAGTNAIGLEVEQGSSLPSSDFLRNIVHDSQSYVVSQNLTAPMTVTGASNYGWTDYGDTDYGPDNDGVTDYYDSDYGALNDGVTDYVEPAASAPATSAPAASAPASSAPATTGTTSGGATYTPAPTPAPAPSGGNSGYSGYDSNSGYDSTSGYSGYDD